MTSQNWAKARDHKTCTEIKIDFIFLELHLEVTPRSMKQFIYSINGNYDRYPTRSNNMSYSRSQSLYRKL